MATETSTRHGAPAPAAGECSEDAVLGGRLVLRQPRRGHRFGHDAILLAAAVAARDGERAVEFGAGVGAAGLALARRVDGLDVTLAEIDPALAALAAENTERNGLAARVRAVTLDVTAPAAALAPADHVLMNPPFNTAQNPSPDPARRAAHVASERTLAQWLDAAARLLRPGGAVTLIWRADGLADVLAALSARFGAVVVLPIHGKAGGPAIRVLVRAVKDRSAPLTLLSGFTLADAEGKPTVAAETVLRDCTALPLV